MPEVNFVLIFIIYYMKYTHINKLTVNFVYIKKYNFVKFLYIYSCPTVVKVLC